MPHQLVCGAVEHHRSSRKLRDTQLAGGVVAPDECVGFELIAWGNMHPELMSMPHARSGLLQHDATGVQALPWRCGSMGFAANDGYDTDVRKLTKVDGHEALAPGEERVAAEARWCQVFLHGTSKERALCVLPGGCFVMLLP